MEWIMSDSYRRQQLWDRKMAEMDYRSQMSSAEKRGEKRTEIRDNLAGIKRAMKKQNLTPEKAMDYMDIPIAERPRYAMMLKENSSDMIPESDGKTSESMKF